MKRFTEYIGKLSDKPQAVPIMSDSKIGTQDCLNRLAEYEDLEEKGLLIELPAGVGKMLYFKKHEKGEPTGIIVGRKIKSVSVSFEMEGDQYLSIPANRLGVDVFTSIKTAEKMLLGGENH